MAEPTMTFEYDDLRKAVGFYLGYGRTTANWDTEQAAQILDAVETGVANFYNAYEWSFLKPITTVTLYADLGIDSGITVSGAWSVAKELVALTSSADAFYPEMVGRSIVVTTIGTYEILEYEAANKIYVDMGTAPNPPADMGSQETFSIASEGRFRLTDDFGGIEGPLTFQTNEGYFKVPVKSEVEIRDRRQRSTYTGKPQIVAVRPLTFVETVGQRFEMVCWPTPGSDYEMTFKMIVSHDNPTAANKYVLGGARHAQAIKESCLASAEILLNDEVGIHNNEYGKLLATSIKNDCVANSPESLGYNRDASDDGGKGTNYRETGSATYNGVQY